MPKTLSEIKKLSAYPDNFEKAIGFIKITQEYTIDVVAAIEKLINTPPSRQSKENDLERLAHTAQKLFYLTLISIRLKFTTILSNYQ
ncbi:hypothetical protein ACH3XW_5495 [Acanthocheilonema viteae]